jgi:hypothetical protein
LNTRPVRAGRKLTAIHSTRIPRRGILIHLAAWSPCSRRWRSGGMKVSASCPLRGVDSSRLNGPDSFAMLMAGLQRFGSVVSPVDEQLHGRRSSCACCRRAVVRGRSGGWSCLIIAMSGDLEKGEASYSPTTLATIRAPGRRGSSPAKAMSGASKAASWSAQARWETRPKGHPWRCPPTATPPSSAGGATTARRWSTARSGPHWLNGAY